MSDPLDHQPKAARNKNNKPSLTEKTAPKLKLVVSNPPPAQESVPPFQPTVLKREITVDIKKRSFDLYEMTIQDPFHDLECDLTVEIEGDLEQPASRSVICHFPAILLQEGNKLMGQDELLYGLVMVQFQMKILEQLLLFCSQHKASHLVIYMDDDQVEGFGVYQDFLIHQDPTLTKNGEQTEMVISANKETIDEWMVFMAATTLNFEQELWREQRSNPVIRHYLKSQQQKETVH
ncbi:MAG: hypothetical protein K0R76_789 [Alphaproteobacteria bacterium]|jgi:hypothetical protein|nr:hypothetical protein [Alphaproteobacteria bacterium]